MGGFVLLSLQEYGNLQSIKRKGAYRILCLGESSTQGQYPSFLEKALNERNIGVHFSVIDKGMVGSNTPTILNRVESFLDEYRPDMVVAMMGINDQKVKYYQGIPEAGQWIFQHCRVYRLGRILWAHFFIKHMLEVKEMGDFKPAIEKSSPIKAETSLKAGELDLKIEDVYVSLERLYNTQGGLSWAEDFFRKAIERNARNDMAYAYLGMVYRKKGEFSKAEDCFRKAIELDPKNYSARVGLGQLYKKQGEFSKAEDSFKKVVEMDPMNDNVYVELGRFYNTQGELSRAEDCYRKAIELDPKNYSARVGLGFLYKDQGEFSKAEDSFKKVVEMDPMNDNVYVELAGLYQAYGQPSKAVYSFKRAIAINPENDWASPDLARLYRDQGKFSEAEDTLKKAIEIKPADDRLLQALSSLYEEAGKPELAGVYARKADSLREHLSPTTVKSYRQLKEILDERRVKLVCAQYPMRNAGPLRKIFMNEEDVVFVDNQRTFKEAVKQGGRKKYFRDMFAGDFGHCTQKGNELLARNIADVILREVFNN